MKYDLVISIVTYNSDLTYVENLSKFLESIKKIKIKTVIADNLSTLSYYNKLLNLKSDVISTGKNYGYGKANNLVNIISPNSKYFLVLNPDIKMKPEVIYEIYDFMEKNNNYGLVGPVLKSTNKNYYNIFRENFNFFNMLKRWLFKIDDTFEKKKFYILTKNYNTVIDVKYISGSFMFFRRDIFNKLGGFNNKFFMYFEDIEICDYIRTKNFNIGVIKLAEVEHLRNRTSYKNFKLFISHFISWLLYKIFNRSKIKL